jgi:hypothetical protein
LSESTSYAVDAPEGASSPGTQYLSKRDAKWLLISAVFLIIGFIPVYLYMREKAWKSTCTKNLGGIMEAMMLYSTDNDNRLPPAFESDNNGEPSIGPDGTAITWVSVIFPHKSERVNFVCPAADNAEYAYSSSVDGTDAIPSTYGYYSIYAGQNLELVDNPDNVILLTETATSGAGATYDPLPFSATKNDGIVIGWNDSNLEPSEQTSAVTRLAFKETAQGKFIGKAGRHQLVNHAITASRMKINITSEVIATEYNRSKYTLSGYWREPILRK